MVTIRCRERPRGFWLRSLIASGREPHPRDGRTSGQPEQFAASLPGDGAHAWLALLTRIW